MQEFGEGIGQSPRIAIDLDDTLTDRGKSKETGKTVLRPGAEKLLRELTQAGCELILYTTARKAVVEALFRDNPDLRRYFSMTFYAENTPKHDLSKIRNPELRKFLEKLDGGEMGGKDPNLVGANVLIDDTVLEKPQEILGFTTIGVPSPRVDSTDGWVAEVLDQLREMEVIPERYSDFIV